VITVNKTETKDLRSLKVFLKKYKLQDSLFMDRLDQTVVILDQTTILGFGAFVKKDDTAIIDVAVISEEALWPTMGDGLVKAMLNTLDLRGVKTAYMLTDKAHESIIKKIGLTKSVKSADEILTGLEAPYILKELDQVYETTLPDFFDHACHSKK